MSQGDCSHFSRQTPNSHGRAVDGDFSLHSLNLSPTRVMELPRVDGEHKIQIFPNFLALSEILQIFEVTWGCVSVDHQQYHSLHTLTLALSLHLAHFLWRLLWAK